MSDNPIADQNNDQPATESNKDMQWFVVQAFSNYEKRVKLTLEESIHRHGMQDLFGEILVPTEEVVEMKSGQKRHQAQRHLQKRKRWVFYSKFKMVQKRLVTSSLSSLANWCVLLKVHLLTSTELLKM